MMSNLQKVWDSPFGLLSDLDRALQGRLEANESERTAKYPVDIHEDDNGLTVHAELPGFKKEQVEVSIDNGVLTIAAQREMPDNEGVTTHLHERRFTRIRRQFTLPTTVDTTDVEATLEDGVLKLTLNKKEDVKPRRIEVK